MLSLIGGLVAAALGVVGLCMQWGDQPGYAYFLKGLVASVPAVLVLAGIIAFVAGIGSLKDRCATAREEAETSGDKEAKPAEKK